MTRDTLISKGTCCGNNCRHCPYGHFNVRNNNNNVIRNNKINQITYLKIKDKNLEKKSSSGLLNVDILFWSGGINSYLALTFIMEDHIRNNNDSKLILLTTFDIETENISYKDTKISIIFYYLLYV